MLILFFKLYNTLNTYYRHIYMIHFMGKKHTHTHLSEHDGEYIIDQQEKNLSMDLQCDP